MNNLKESDINANERDTLTSLGENPMLKGLLEIMYSNIIVGNEIYDTHYAMLDWGKNPIISSLLDFLGIEITDPNEIENKDISKISVTVKDSQYTKGQFSKLFNHFGIQMEELPTTNDIRKKIGKILST